VELAVYKDVFKLERERKRIPIMWYTQEKVEENQFFNI